MSFDTYFASVPLLLHMDGANNSTTFTDSSSAARTVSVFGNAKISTAQSQFGGASGYFDGSGDYLTVPDSADFAFGAGNFTIEAWIRPAANTSHVIASHWTTGTATLNSFLFYLASGKLQLSYGSGATNTGTPSTTGITNNVWTHVAVSVSSGVVRYFINGVLDATTFTIPGALNDCNQPFYVGCYLAGGGPASFFNGYIDDFRVTKGVARYTATFTPPALAYPNRGAQVSGAVLDAAGNPAARTIRAYRRDTGVLVGSGVSNGTTGAYTVDIANYDGEVNVICLDDDAGTLENDLIHRAIPV